MRTSRGGSARSFELGGSDYTAGTCAAPTPTVEVPPAGYETTVRLCGTAPSSTGCEDRQLCTRIPSAPLCVWAQGDLECPAGYDDRRLLYSGFGDARDCTECSCTLIAAAECEIADAALVGNSCGGMASGVVYLEPGDCTQYAGTVRSIVLPQTPMPSASCLASASDPTGEATPTVAATLCCSP